MGSCLSKKDAAAVENNAVKVVVAPQTEQQFKKAEDVKKEIFVIKHRRSHSNSSIDKQHIQIHKLTPELPPVRTSSCNRDEVDAILIQCGRISRSSSANVTPVAKTQSGSKQSFDFDNEDEMRQSRSGRSSSPASRRRTVSRERTLVAGSGRRFSRSPGRQRSEMLAVVESGATAKPGKMVSVPASVTSSISVGNDQISVRRIAVRRDVRSPRSQSPAQSRQQHPPLILSRSNSRKSDRRNPLSEIDNNHHSDSQVMQISSRNESVEEDGNISMRSMRGANVETIVNVVRPKFIRSRSWSRSRDLDDLVRGMSPNPNTKTSSYASILLEDIQNFHQKGNIKSNVANALPQCVTKACSIVEPVDDMNSVTSSTSIASGGKQKHQMVEAGYDLKEQNLHETTRRGTLGGSNGSDTGDEESSGSNSVAGGCQQQQGSPLGPNSVESFVGLTSKTTSSLHKEVWNPLGFPRQEFH